MKLCKVIKEFVVNDENLSHSGAHAVGEIIEIHDDQFGQLMQAGYIEFAKEGDVVSKKTPSENVEIKKSAEDSSVGSADTSDGEGSEENLDEKEEVVSPVKEEDEY